MSWPSFAPRGNESGGKESNQHLDVEDRFEIPYLQLVLIQGCWGRASPTKTFSLSFSYSCIESSLQNLQRPREEDRVRIGWSLLFSLEQANAALSLISSFLPSFPLIVRTLRQTRKSFPVNLPSLGRAIPIENKGRKDDG